MCYAIPGKIIKRNATTGVIDYFGEHRNILLDDDLVVVQVGDYVYAQGGVLVRKLGEKEAKEILIQGAVPGRPGSLIQIIAK